MEDDFSCGFLWDAPNGETLMLCRYNGSSHIHRNKIEGKTFGPVFHIHRATKKYISASQNPDGFAYETDKYQTLEKALACLISDCNIEGLEASPKRDDQFELFK